MLKTDIRHQLWLTRKTFQRRLGGKEDDCVVASDSELDAKIELFKFIQIEGNILYRIIDQYQERICILAQEENSLGRFLKESGKHSQTTDGVMINCGKSFSYCGQVRFLIRPPLLRFFNEIEVFTRRAVADTESTITLMEKQRTNYRASLSWMKSVSNMLDPDSNRMLEKFRVAQTQVRQTKERFDKYSLDCLQKIDLLAASRCNMFSHILISYMENLQDFFIKSTDTLRILSSALAQDSNYGFDILKVLSKTQNNYKELKNFLQCPEKDESNNKLNSPLFCDAGHNYGSDRSNDDIPCVLLDDISFNFFEISNEFNNEISLKPVTENVESNNDTAFNHFAQQPSASNENSRHSSDATLFISNYVKRTVDQNDSKMHKNIKNCSWFDLFSELDPLANPDDMTKQFGGKVADTQAA
ncbi:islet cell autoantigen 1 [Condylostylus longicornis]|uniref:islet cell autoantigen 1 n=1 Tax=Condylostylus longicornis TaxID=2530218 RepID=UPI00244E35AD|nr:islet cell autoantigen 1 [Condylostylus longicornis]